MAEGTNGGAAPGGMARKPLFTPAGAATSASVSPANAEEEAEEAGRWESPSWL